MEKFNIITIPDNIAAPYVMPVVQRFLDARQALSFLSGVIGRRFITVADLEKHLEDRDETTEVEIIATTADKTAALEKYKDNGWVYSTIASLKVD